MRGPVRLSAIAYRGATGRPANEFGVRVPAHGSIAAYNTHERPCKVS